MRANSSAKALASGVEVEDESSSCSALRREMSALMASSCVVKVESCLRRDFKSVMRLRFFFSSTSLSFPESTSASRDLHSLAGGSTGDRGLYFSVDFVDGAVVDFSAFRFDVVLVSFDFGFQGIQLRLNPGFPRLQRRLFSTSSTPRPQNFKQR